MKGREWKKEYPWNKIKKIQDLKEKFVWWRWNVKKTQKFSIEING